MNNPKKLVKFIFIDIDLDLFDKIYRWGSTRDFVILKITEQTDTYELMSFSEPQNEDKKMPTL